jgi:lipopolysaccharide export LptBFGC system permease protein LptF
MSYKLNKVINILIYLLIIVVIGVFFINNKDIYCFKHNLVINNLKDFKKYKEYNYVSMNLKEAKITRLSLSEDKKEKLDVYIVNFDNKNILVTLNKNTVLTKKVSLIKTNDDSIINDIKDTLSMENEIEFEDNFYYSNEDYNQNKLLLSIKYYSSIILSASCIILMLINLLLIIFHKNNTIDL